jgi:two-component system, LuxR family, response regulator FixJ
MVCVLEDDDAVRHSLRFSLEVEGFAVREYATGAEFLDAPNTAGAVCLVVDCNLPDMTGLEVISRLRSRGSSMPALIITGQLTASLVKSAAAERAMVIEKPFLGAALLNNLHSLCGV